MKKYFYYNSCQSLVLLIAFSIESLQQEAAVISDHIKKAAEGPIILKKLKNDFPII